MENKMESLVLTDSLGGSVANRDDLPMAGALKASAEERTGKSSSAFKTISEVADELGVQQHVLRFWETKFSQVRPLKRGGGRRYYRPEDVQLLHAIHNLLYVEGYTIKGVQKLLREMGKKKILDGVEIVPQKKQEESVSDVGHIRDNQNPLRQTPAAAITVAKPAGADEAIIPTRKRLTGTQREVLDGLLGELKEIRKIIRSED